MITKGTILIWNTLSVTKCPGSE